MASGRLGVGEEPPAAERREPAPVLVLCATCRQPIRYNEILGISFCPVHGLSSPFTFIPLSQSVGLEPVVRLSALLRQSQSIRRVRVYFRSYRWPQTSLHDSYK